MISLIIKGQPLQAEYAASCRGIEISVMGRNDYGETLATTQGPYDRVVAWFTEDPDTVGFPVGTLLHYRVCSACF